MSPQNRGALPIVVIGAGIVGISCALALQRKALDVIVVDRLEPGEACSYGNAGVIATSSCTPLIMPGAIRKAPGWLTKRDGPLAIDWRYLPHMARWLSRAVLCTGPEAVLSTGRALHALHRNAVDDHLSQATAAGCANLIDRASYLFVYQTQAGFRADEAGWRLRTELGIEFEEIDAAQIRDREPALAPIFVRGMVADGHAVVRDPGGLTKRLAAAFALRQGRLLRAEVRGIRPFGDGKVEIACAGKLLTASHVIVAAGAWSAEMGRPLGHRFPLAAERGYHVMFERPGIALTNAVMLSERKLVATSMNGGLRIAGTAEFAPLDRPPTKTRADVIQEAATGLFNGLNTRIPHRWMGPRPSLPDTLPVIGRSHLHPSVSFAFGHGHTGLTASATTGRIIAAVVAGETPPVDITPFRTDRFERGGLRSRQESAVQTLPHEEMSRANMQWQRQ